MALTCIICSAICKKSDSVVCALCNEYQHVECLLKMSNLTQNDNISKVKPGYSFGCKKCSNSSNNTMTKKIDAVEKQLLDLTNIIKESVTSQLADIKVDLSKSIYNSQKFEEETSKKIDELEYENNSLRKQLNRSDILVNGLPSYMTTEDLYSTAISIGKACDINISEYDIHFCAWIKKKSAVLIKFNNVLKRDLIMKNYRKKYDLKLCDVTETDIEKRIYLNNHFIPLEAKLHYLCRSKIKLGEIKSYRIHTYSNPIKIKLINANNEEESFTAPEFINHKSNLHNTNTNLNAANTGHKPTKGITSTSANIGSVESVEPISADDVITF